MRHTTKEHYEFIQPNQVKCTLTTTAYIGSVNGFKVIITSYGRSKYHPDDSMPFDMGIGKKIAYKRAQLKMYEKLKKILVEYITNCEDDLTAAVMSLTDIGTKSSTETEYLCNLIKR